MLQSVQVRNDLGALKVTLPLSVPTSSQSYFIKSIDGLGPTEASIAMSTFANYDGSVYHASRANRRNILMTIGYSPNYAANQDISTLRKKMYKNFPPKSEVELRFIDSKDETLKVSGRVEKVTPNMFSKDPEIVVSILCPDAYFSSLSNVSINSDTTKTLDLSSYGDADVGFYFEMTVPRDFGQLLFRNQIDSLIRFDHPFLSGDVIRVSTRPGSKYAILSRGSTDTSLLDAMYKSTLVMNFNDKVTAFTVRATAGGTIPFNLQFLPKWMGV